MSNCRHCNNQLNHQLIDLGHAPPSNNYLDKDSLLESETHFPLKLLICDNCWLIQTIDYNDAENLFKSDYAYFSSTSQSWIQHSLEYSNKIIDKLSLDNSNFVVEIASNDGYLLQNFIHADIPCLGIEPTESTALVAEEKGIEVIKEFFTEDLSKKLSKDKKADLIIGNNVFAHVPDINDFSLGIKRLLSKEGVITLEFPHLMELILNMQFDTIYHEHFSYLSLYTVSRVFKKAGLKIFDVEQIKTHGGSLRVYGCHEEDTRKVSEKFTNLLQKEKEIGMQKLSFYKDFQSKSEIIKNEFLSFLLDCKKKGKRVGSYGAAAKGNTLLNYAGIKNDLIEFVCDAAQSKQGKFLPGSHIPINKPSYLESIDSLDFLIIFPWNISSEIIKNLDYLKKRGTKFIIAIPELTIL